MVISVNKRLDDWVGEDCLDTRKVQFPRKDGTATGQNTGVTTPKRFISNSMGPLGSNLTMSRPTSPKAENENDLVNGNTVMAAAIQKKINRKRKVSINKRINLLSGTHTHTHDLFKWHTQQITFQ